MNGRRTQIQFLEDILVCTEKIMVFTKKMNFEEFKKNQLVVDAVLRNLEILGEASRNIPEDIRQRFPEVPWKKMTGLRNIVAHQYFAVDLAMVWQIVTKNILETEEYIKPVLKRLRDDEKASKK